MYEIDMHDNGISVICSDEIHFPDFAKLNEELDNAGVTEQSLLLDFRKINTDCECFIPCLGMFRNNLRKCGLKKMSVLLCDDTIVRAMNFMIRSVNDDDFIKFFNKNEEGDCEKWTFPLREKQRKNCIKSQR